MSGNLILVIRGKDNNQEFKLKEFTKECEDAYGGQILKPSKSGIDWTLEWSGSESELKDVIAKAEKGRIDILIKKHNGLYLLELTKNEEYLYSYIPDIPLEGEGKKTKNVTVDEVKQLAPQVDVLLMTATEIERKAVLAEMEPWRDREEILRGSLSKTTFNFGRFGRYRTAHVECTMGYEGQQDAILTIERTINELNPKAVLVLGIAFGIDPKKQRLGDVIVAESVYPYDAQRVGETSNIPKGTSILCGSILSERFRTRRSHWELVCGIRPVKVHGVEPR